MSCRAVIIGLVAGESSGDILGAMLMSTLLKFIPNIYFVGVAGPCMQKIGIEVWYETKELEVLGVSDVLINLHKFISMRKNLIHRFNKLQPNVFIGIDAPDFNFTLEYNLKKQGIYVIHYVSPAIWAWRKKRIIKIGQSTNNILVCFPFEKTFYDQHNIPCQFIGHPLADLISLNPDKISARRTLGIAMHKKCLALLPGSRKSEIKMLSSIFLHCAAIVKQHFIDLEILVPLTSEARLAQFKYIQSNIKLPINVRILNHHQSHQAMIAADVALLASGTATLECMLAKCPMVVGYKLNKFNFLFAKCLVKTQWISLPNLLAQRTLVKEFLQGECQPEKLARELIFLLNNKYQCIILKNIFYKIHQQIRCNANEKATYVILDFLFKKGLL